MYGRLEGKNVIVHTDAPVDPYYIGKMLEFQPETGQGEYDPAHVTIQGVQFPDLSLKKDVVLGHIVKDGRKWPIPLENIISIAEL